MTQVSDWSVDNAGGGAVRAQMNGIFAAIQSSNSGPTAPSPTVAGMHWLDTGAVPAVMKRRNSANTGWDKVSPGVSVSDQSGGYTIVEEDRYSFIRCTSATTVSFPPVADLGSDWSTVVKAESGVVTLDPDGSETIDGAATKTLQTGEWAVIYCDGSALYTVVAGPPTEIWALLWDHSVDGNVNVVESPQLEDGYEYRMVGSRVSMDQAGALGIEITFNGDVSPVSGVASATDFCAANSNENEFIADFGHVRRAGMPGRLIRVWRGPSNTNINSTPKILGERDGDTFTVSAIDDGEGVIDKVAVYAAGAAEFDGGKIYLVKRRVNYA